MSGPSPPSSATKLVIILTVVGVFAVAGIIVVLIRLLGGDEPAPQVIIENLARNLV